MRFAVTGATGRMGQAIVRLGHDAGDTFVFGHARSGSSDPKIHASFTEFAAAKPDVLIDFSSPANFHAVLAAAVAAKVPFVSGTTGLGPDAFAALEAAAPTIPVLWAPNTSLGVAVLAKLVAQASKALAGFDLEIVEVHHRKKLDAPSGTALRLAEAAQIGRVLGSGAPGNQVYGRSGKQTEVRDPDEVGMFALRGGDVIGDHHVHFFGEGERIELVHRATNRDLFARGALAAARFVIGKPPARYAFEDVLGLGPSERSEGDGRADTQSLDS